MTIYTDITQHIHLPAEVATITNRLVETFHPERVYLFGSVARGDATADSDLDFMVVVADSSLPQYRRSQEAQRALFAIKQAKDVLVWTREELYWTP
ncbi:MAG: nucleotidyltransferase domain-containing protein [Roseiflexaceae bacterium]|nr:nucleotidyltransferase domain-containing protein [Roseiflexaceae bacterium]